MGLFSGPKVPNTIKDDRWFSLKKAAGRQEARDGGMFSKKACDRRTMQGKSLKKSFWN